MDERLIEDVWISAVTTQKQLRKALRTPTDIKVQVELDVEQMKKDDSEEGSEEPLGAKDTSRFRAISARIHFLSQDRPDLLFAGKHAAGTCPVPRSETGKR